MTSPAPKGPPGPAPALAHFVPSGDDQTAGPAWSEPAATKPSGPAATLVMP
jgi:hypothetical protein